MDTDWNTWMVSTFGVSTPSFTTPFEYSSELIEEIKMKIKMLVDIGGLYNGKDIPKKGETWDTDKNNAVDLINKGWAEAVKSAPKKTASAKAGKEKS